MPAVLLITPPMVQVNAPYAATPALAGFLRGQNITCAQADFSLALALKLFSPQGLDAIHATLATLAAPTEPIRIFLEEFDTYKRDVAPVVHFLQTHDPALAHRIAAAGFLPAGWRLQRTHGAPDEAEEDLLRFFGYCGTHDRAVYLASLFLDEISDVIRDGIDPHFGFARYAEQLAESLPTLDPLLRALDAPPTLLTRWLDELTNAALAMHAPELVALTCPFPGTLLGAFHIARRVKATHPATRVVLGGGYPSTELRELDDKRVYDFFDAVILDDGRAALLSLLRGTDAPSPTLPSCPDFSGLPLDSYLSLTEMANPMHRLWSDACWLKLPLTQGCYWGKCAFCDTSLPYIRDYAEPSAQTIADHLCRLHDETGKSGFHFTDEALRPQLLEALSAELIARRTAFAWWGNIRFERHFTPRLAAQMAEAGCVGVTGGLECANDRLLRLMKKGITLDHARDVLRAFADAGILTHAYLIYGFPTQTLQEISDALDYVRRRFLEGSLQSAFWHRFSLTAHSPMLAAAETLHLHITEPKQTQPRFARNAVTFREDRPNLPDWDVVGQGLRRATYNYMLGVGLDTPVTKWFDIRLPRPKPHG